MRRVLMISSFWPPRVVGGAEMYASALAQRLRERDVEVGAVTLGVDAPDVVASVRAWPYVADGTEDPSRLAWAALHARDLYNPETRRVLARVLDDFRPDVVHSHAIAGLSAIALALPAQRGVPHVHTLHDYWLLCDRSTMQSDIGPCVHQCLPCRTISQLRTATTRRHAPDVMIAVSQALAREHGRLPWVQRRLRVVPNPVEAPEGIARHRPPSAGATFGYIGRLTGVKGLDLLVDAFDASGLAGSCTLLVAGRGPLAPRVDASPAGVQNLGWVDDAGKESFFERIDCLVVPSRWRDPAPLVVNEARARGIPVVGARIGGIPELVPPGSEPLLFAPGSVDELADRLRSYATDPARFRPPEHDPLPGWDAHLDEILTAYHDAAGT
jgi:glycosyltransferase involved in cell wall biosynthesis